MRKIDAHQDPRVHLANLAKKVCLENLAHLVYPACPAHTHQFPFRPMDAVGGAHRVPPVPPAHLAPLDQLETTDNPATPAHHPKMAALDHLAPLAALATKANQVTPAQQAMPVATHQLVKKATTVHPAGQASPVRLATTPNVEAQANRAVQDHPDHPETQAPVANQRTKAHLERKDHQEVQAKMPNIVHVQNVPRLRKRKSRKPKMDRTWNFIFYSTIQSNFSVNEKEKFWFYICLLEIACSFFILKNLNCNLVMGTV